MKHSQRLPGTYAKLEAKINASFATYQYQCGTEEAMLLMLCCSSFKSSSVEEGRPKGDSLVEEHSSFSEFRIV